MSDWLEDVAEPRNVGGRPPKDHRGRQRKLLCESCGFIAYTTAGSLERAGGLPSCACGSAMFLPNLRDRAAVEWDELAAELERQGQDAYNAAMRELGYRDMIVPVVKNVKRDGSNPDAMHRCECCSKLTGGRQFCPEHDPFTSGGAHYADRRGV